MPREIFTSLNAVLLYLIGGRSHSSANFIGVSFKLSSMSYQPTATNSHHTFIIAEAGVNHNGSLDTAIQMVDVAVAAGADAVKFQTFKAEKMISSGAPKAGYQMESTGAGESQLEMVRKLELDETAHKKLFRYCKNRGILFLSSPFDLESIDLLNRLGMQIFKIPSGEITNLPYLRKLGALSKSLILSTGMADLGGGRGCATGAHEGGDLS